MYKFILKLNLSESHNNNNNNNNNNNKADKTHKSTQCPVAVSAYALDGVTEVSTNNKMHFHT